MTEEAIRELFDQNAEQMKETDRQMRETKQMIQELTESQKETDQMMKETDRQMKETDRRWEKTKDEIDELREISRKIERHVGNDARIVEDHFVKALKHLNLQIGDIAFDEIYDNLSRHRKLDKGMEGMQLDALLVNGSHTAILEVKKFLHVNDVHKVFNKTLPRFRRLFPEHSDKNLLIMVGGASANQDAVKAAQDYGFVVLLQEGQNISIDTSHQKTY